MKAIEQLERLGQGLQARQEQASLGQLTRFLDQLTHDLNNPLGTFSLELFSLELIIGKLAAAHSAGDLQALAREVQTLSALCQNLQGAFQAAQGLLEAIDARSAALQGEEG